MEIKINSTRLLITFMLLSLIFIVLFFTSDDFKNFILQNEVKQEPKLTIVEQYFLDNKTKQAELESYTEKLPTEPIFFEYDETIEVCEQVSGMTKSLQELAANDLKTSMRNISFVRTAVNYAFSNKGWCVVVFDTPNGTQAYSLSTIVKNKNEYLATTTKGGQASLGLRLY